MDEETFLELFHGSHVRTNQTLTNVGRWEPGVLARLLSFIDIVHALGFDIYQTNHYESERKICTALEGTCCVCFHLVLISQS